MDGFVRIIHNGDAENSPITGGFSLREIDWTTGIRSPELGTCLIEAARTRQKWPNVGEGPCRTLGIHQAD